MSRPRWAVSLFVLWHLTALGLGSLPSPDRLPKIDNPRHPTDDPIAAVVTPPLDTATAIFSHVPPLLSTAIQPLRPVIDIYISLTGLGQRWSMFWSPPTVDQYLRVRYYIGSDGSRGSIDSPVWMATELVLPAHREDQIRTFQSFRDSYRDKAMAIALDDFYQHRPRELVRPDTTSGELPDDLAPIARYFARQFKRNHLQPHERIVRTEVWYGSVSNPGRGSSLDSTVYEERRETLRSYHEAPVENHLNVPPYPPYHAGEQESDISWLLEFFE